MGFGEDETCPIFYHKWVSKRPLVHLLAQKIRFKNGQIRSNLAKVHQTDIYAKTPEIRGFPVFCRQIGLKYGKNQRLENWGARRAAFRPYYFFFGSEKVLVCLYFSDRDSNLTPNLTPTGVSRLRQETTVLD